MSMSSFDTVMSVLSDVQRRDLLLSLRHEDEFSPLATCDEDYELRILLTHTHFPRLEEHGFITWDQATGVVKKGPNFGDVKPFLALFEDHRHEFPSGLHHWE